MSLISSNKDYIKLLECLRPYVAKTKEADRIADNKTLFDSFQKHLELNNISNLTTEIFEDFTTFSKNKHWSNIQRNNKTILEDFDRFKVSMGILLDERIAIEQRIDSVLVGEHRITGLGFSIISAILITVFPEKYAVLNLKVKSVLKDFNLFDEKKFKKEKPSLAYLRVLEIAHSLGEDLGVELIDLDVLWHYALTDRPKIYKHSPGKQGSDLQNQIKESVVAIGWNSCGSLDRYEENLDEAAQHCIDNKDGKDKSYIGEQFSYLLSMKKNDIVFYYVKGEIVNIGIVEDAPYFFSDAEFGHRRKVKLIQNFNRFKIKNVDIKDYCSQTITLGELDSKLSSKLLKELSIYNSQINWNDLMKINNIPNVDINSFNGFKQEAFDLLSTFEVTPVYETYESFRDSFYKQVHAPLKEIFSRAKANLPAELMINFQTKKNILSKIPKNDYGQGGINPYLWGAFYFNEVGRSDSCQLFIVIKKDFIRTGFGFGNKSEKFKNKFLKNIENHSDFFIGYLELLKEYQLKCQIDDKSDLTAQREEVALNYENIMDALKTNNQVTFCNYYEPSEAIEKGSLISDEVTKLFYTLLPLMYLASMNDPETMIKRWQKLILNKTEILDISEDLDDNLDGLEEYTWESFIKDMSWDAKYSEAENILHCLGDFKNQNSKKRNIIFAGPPGTGKSLCSKKLAELITNKKESNVYRVQFHQSYSYEQFIQGIRPTPSGNGQMTFDFYSGPFLEFCKKANENENENFVFIIDEINRGNLSRIFGELMYLLEYPEEEMSLLYDQSIKLRIPKNAYIIGTMNTADRSIALVDYALRRRFRFIDFASHSDIIDKYYKTKTKDFVNILSFFDNVNEKIARIDKRLSIGHSYLIRADLQETGLSKEEFFNIWKYEIYSLLSEYFVNNSNQLEIFKFEAIWKEVEEKENHVQKAS